MREGETLSIVHHIWPGTSMVLASARYKDSEGKDRQGRIEGLWAKQTTQKDEFETKRISAGALLGPMGTIDGL